MAFFSALGKIIKESSGPYLLEELNVLAKGSINSFLKEKSHKCKRMLPFKIVHFESYLTSRNLEEVFGTIIQYERDLDRFKYQYLHTSTKEFELTEDYLLYVYSNKRGKRKNN